MRLTMMKDILYAMASLTMEEVFIVTGIAIVLIGAAVGIMLCILDKDPAAGYGPVDDDEED